LTALFVLLHLGGAVALLLWATRMVRTGVERAYGQTLKTRLRRTLRNPFAAAGFGGLMAIALQSSTAVVLLVSSFVGSGFVSVAAGLIAVRGGELGSALLVKVLFLDLTALIPLLLMAGTAMFLTTERRSWRQIGRISVGIALLLLSLDMTREATAPLRDSAALPAIITYLSSDPISAFLIAAILTYLFHSSIAGVILVANFAHHDLMDHHLALVMVLGVNFGSALIAPLLTRHAPPEQRIVPLGNLLMRGCGSLFMLGCLSFFTLSLDFLGEGASDKVINFHIGFNMLIMLFGLIFAKPALLLTQKLVALMTSPTLPEAVPQSPFPPTALDRSALGKNPATALACARREIIRLSDIVDVMLERISNLYQTPALGGIAEIAEMIRILDRRQENFTLYLAELGTTGLEDDAATQMKRLLDASTKLQQTGHIISHNLLEGAKILAHEKLVLSQEDRIALTHFCQRVLANARLAFYLLVSSDVATAGQLVREKDHLRDTEQQLRHQHFERLQTGLSINMPASTLYLDLLNDLKQVNALLTAIAYPILEGQGLLKQTRLTAKEV